MAEEAVDFRFGLACAEEAAVVLQGSRSLEIEEFLGSIVKSVWEREEILSFWDFNQSINEEKRFIARKMEGEMERSHWMGSTKVWLEELKVEVWVETDWERRGREDLEVERE